MKDIYKFEDALRSERFENSIDRMFKKQQLPKALEHLTIQTGVIESLENGWIMVIKQDTPTGERVLTSSLMNGGYTTALPTSARGRRYAYKHVKQASHLIHGENGGRDSRIGQTLRGLRWKAYDLLKG